MDQYTSAVQYQYGQYGQLLPETGGITLPMIVAVLAILIASIYFAVVLLKG